VKQIIASPWLERNELGYTGYARHDDDTVLNIDSPMSEADVYQALITAHCHPRDVLEAIQAADRSFAQGRNEERRYFHDLYDRAQHGDVTANDIDRLVTKLQRSNPPAPVSYYLTILDATRATQCEELVASYLHEWADFNDTTTAVRVLLDWGLAEKYEERIVQLLRGVVEDTTHEVQRWTFALIAWVLSEETRGEPPPEIPQGQKLRFLTEMLHVAESLPPDDVAKLSIVTNLAHAVGFGLADAYKVPEDRVLKRARERLRELA
jgi:hypothetical protein